MILTFNLRPGFAHPISTGQGAVVGEPTQGQQHRKSPLKGPATRNPKSNFISRDKPPKIMLIPRTVISHRPLAVIG